MNSIVCACGKQVEEQADRAGNWITCPGCGGALYSPFPGAKPSAPTVLEGIPSSTPTRLCALCAETIPVSDATCKFCGSNPNGVAPQSARPPQPSSTAALANDGGLPALIVGLVGYMVCGLLSPVAWMMGRKYEADCRAKGIEPSGVGRAGTVVGLIGTVFLAFNFVWLVLWIVAQCL